MNLKPCDSDPSLAGFLSGVDAGERAPMLRSAHYHSIEAAFGKKTGRRKHEQDNHYTSPGSRQFSSSQHIHRHGRDRRKGDDPSHKDPNVTAFDEATFARLVESDFNNGTIEVKVLSKLFGGRPELCTRVYRHCL